ncbi:2-succinylbenzoate--CoA ligase chloroplastic/peroxisomal [Bienertia sinuspersici]
MGEKQSSRAHVCQCLNRLLTFRRFSTVTIVDGRRKTGLEFVASVLRLADKLSELGLVPGHIVAICAFNSDWYLEWMLAVAYVGGIIAPLNYRWSLEESKLALNVIEPVMLVTDKCCTWLSELQNGTMFSPRWHVSVAFHCSTAHGRQECERPLPKAQSMKYCWAHDDVVIICFTSGSTGRPKGVAISHSSLIMQSMAKIAIVGYTEDDECTRVDWMYSRRRSHVYLHTAPLCHIGGISSCFAMLMVGGCHVLIPKFEVNMAAKAIKENQVTSFITVPMMLASLVAKMSPLEFWSTYGIKGENLLHECNIICKDKLTQKQWQGAIESLRHNSTSMKKIPIRENEGNDLLMENKQHSFTDTKHSLLLGMKRLKVGGFEALKEPFGEKDGKRPPIP